MDESQRQQFLTSFSERVNDIVVEMKMVELIAPARAFSEMNLIPQSRNSLWGLIVVCSHSLYFYVPSREQALFSMINVSANAKNFEEQIFCFNNADGLQFKLPKRSWFKFFGPEKIIFSFISNGHEIGGFFNVSKDTQKILDSMLKAYRS